MNGEQKYHGDFKIFVLSIIVEENHVYAPIVYFHLYGLIYQD